MSQEKIKSLMDKINLLMNVFMKDGLEKVSQLEKDLLKEQVHALLEQVDNLELKTSISTTNPLAEEKKVSEVKPTLDKTKPITEVPANQNRVEEAKPSSPPIAEQKELPNQQEEEVKVFRTNKPHRTLKSVIDLNKSFILKEELFENDNEQYTIFINELAEIDSEEKSFKFIEKKKETLNWGEENKAYDLLRRAVEKRFLPLLEH